MIARSDSDSDRLEYLLHFDYLTELPNQLLLRELFEQTKIGLENFLNGAEEALLPLFLLELDNFNQFTADLGETDTGSLLKIITARLSKDVSGINSIVRVAPNQFVLILNPPRVSGKIVELAQKALEVIKLPAQDALLTGSLGIALYPCDGKDLDTLVAKARFALEQAKARGGNDFEFYIPIIPQSFSVDEFEVSSEWIALTPQEGDQTLDLLTELTDLARGLEENQLELYYQPQFDLHKSQVIGAEAQIYWNHPERGPVSVEEVLNKVIKSDQAASLHLMLRQIKEQLQDWVMPAFFQQYEVWQQSQKLKIPGRTGRERSRSTRTIALKLPYFLLDPACFDFSLTQLQHSNAATTSCTSLARQKLQYYSKLRSWLRRTGLNPKSLVVEVDETTLLHHDPKLTKWILAELKARGISLSLVNFGSERSYASLNYLEWSGFEFDSLALSPDLIQRCTSTTGQKIAAEYYINIAKAAIWSAHYQKVAVIAQGVESEAEKDFLELRGCDVGQGNFYSPALRLEDFEKLLVSSNLASPKSARLTP